MLGSASDNERIVSFSLESRGEIMPEDTDQAKDSRGQRQIDVPLNLNQSCACFCVCVQYQSAQNHVKTLCQVALTGADLSA